MYGAMSTRAMPRATFGSTQLLPDGTMSLTFVQFWVRGWKGWGGGGGAHGLLIGVLQLLVAGVQLLEEGRQHPAHLHQPRHLSPPHLAFGRLHLRNSSQSLRGLEASRRAWLFGAVRAMPHRKHRRSLCLVVCRADVGCSLPPSPAARGQNGAVGLYWQLFR